MNHFAAHAGPRFCFGGRFFRHRRQVNALLTRAAKKLKAAPERDLSIMRGLLIAFFGSDAGFLLAAGGVRRRSSTIATTKTTAKAA